ncbi:MAG TPA: ATP-binding protein, partial [Candidatus Poseidoniales archaeon]|nr:ATP-binding protein [Candidatus Poseidoniales archaeon]
MSDDEDVSEIDEKVVLSSEDDSSDEADVGFIVVDSKDADFDEDFDEFDDSAAVIDIPVTEWLDDVEFSTTADVPIPDRLVDQVIGQEAASMVIRKAAEQRRHVMMIGDPGTGKSMLARSMTELLPEGTLEDILCYPNEEDENEPRVRSIPAGRGERIVKAQREAVREKRESQNRVLLYSFAAIGILFAIVAILSGQLFSLFFGMLLLAFAYMFIRSRLAGGDEAR